MEEARPEVAARTREPLGPVEWAAIAVIGVALAVFSVQALRGSGSPRIELESRMAVETNADGNQAARIDTKAWDAEWRRAGLPATSGLDGSDPVPVRALAQEAERWSRTSEVEALEHIGMVLLALEEHRAALECFAALAELEPDQPRWNYLTGVEAQALGLGDVAIAELRKASELDPTYVTTFARLGLLHLERGELDDAEAAYRRYVDIRPDESMGYLGLGRVALQRDDPRRALELLRKAVDAQPRDFMAQRYLGQAAARAGFEDEAARASRLSDTLPQYSGWLGFDARIQEAHALANTQRHLENEMRRAQSSGDAAALIDLGNRLLTRRPGDYNTLALVAASYVQTSRPEEAAPLVAEAVRLKPDSTPTLLLQAQIAMRLRDYATGYAALATAEALDPESARPHDLRARLLFLERRFVEAVSSMQKALELDPDANDSRHVLAVMLQQSNRPAEARLVLREVVARDPANADAAARLAALDAAFGGR